MQKSQWVNFLSSWIDGHRIVSLSIQISLFAIVNITTTITINLFAEELTEVCYIKSVEHKLTVSTTDMCHLPLLTKISVLFQTVHLLLLPNR